MQKNNITNKITPCCGLPFSVIYWWVSNLTLNSESDRQFILSKISQNGILSIDGWKVLVNSGKLEADASLTKAEFLAWFNCERQPSCEQLKLIIEGYKMGNWVGDLNEIRFVNVLGNLKIADTAPTTQGPYILSDVGTYTNLGGLVTTADKLNYAYFNGTTWSLVAADLPQPIVNNYTNNNTYNLDSQQIVPSEALYNDETLAGDILKRVDKTTGENVNYRETTTWHDGSLMDESKVDGIVYLKNNNQYYVLTDFKNGIITKDFDLKGGIFTAGNKLEFRGGSFSNGTIKGNNTTIIADAVKIFGLDLVLSGGFKSSSVYAEWYGSIANDYTSVDLAISLQKLYKVFNVINLNVGTYYTNIGGVKVKKLIGFSKAETIIDVRTDNLEGFFCNIGTINGDYNQRSFSDEISHLSLSIQSETGQRTKGISGIVVGATQKSIINDVRIMINAPFMQLTADDLLIIKSDVKNNIDNYCNKGIEFLGSTELDTIENTFIYADIPISFNSGCDFVNINKSVFACGLNGLTNIYFDGGQYTNINITDVSINQGLHGIYFNDSETGLLSGISINDSRIEQLNRIKQNGEFLGCAVYMGNCGWVDGIIFKNLTVPSLSNGFYFKSLLKGSINFDDINCIDVSDDIKDYAINATFAPASIAKININNFLFPTNKLNFNNFTDLIKTNGNFISNEKITLNSLRAKNIPNGSIVSSYANVKFDLDSKMRYKSEVTDIAIPANNTNYIDLFNSNVNTNTQGLQFKKIKVEISDGSFYDFSEFVYKSDLSVETIIAKVNSIISMSSGMVADNFNLLIDSSGIVFLFNKTQRNLNIKITSENFY